MVLKKIYKSLVRNFFLTVYGKVYLDKSKPKKRKIYSKLFDTKYDYYFYEIDNARVYTDKHENVSIIKNNKLIDEISYQQIKGNLVKNSSNEVLKSGTPKFLKKFKGKTLMLAQGASGYKNYSHWFLDIIPRIKLFKLIYKQNIDYIYLNDPNSFQKESLKKFGLEKIRFINSIYKRHILAEKLLICSHPYYNKGTIMNAQSNIPKWIIKFLKNTFVDLSKKNYKNKIKIFIDRSDSDFTHCKLINNENIKKYLIKNGFEIIKLSELSLKKQIEKFSNAKIIVGPHGAGFTNLVFCKRKTKVVEIKPKNHPNKVYERISKINNLSYKKIALPLQKNKIEGDMILKINKLSKFI